MSGHFAILENPVGDHQTEQWQDLQEELSEVGLSLNYEGTLVFSDSREEMYGIHLLSRGEDEEQSQFVAVCEENDILIDKDSVRPYVCVWYNGSDSDMSEMTLEKFRGK